MTRKRTERGRKTQVQELRWSIMVKGRGGGSGSVRGAGGGPGGGTTEVKEGRSSEGDEKGE